MKTHVAAVGKWWCPLPPETATMHVDQVWEEFYAELDSLSDELSGIEFL